MTATTIHRDLAALVGDDLSRQALTAKRNLQRSLERAQAAPPNYHEERVRIATRKAAGEFMDAIEAIRQAASPSDVQKLEAELLKRLRKGYALPANATRDRLWIRLLAEYELVSDCLATNAIGRYLDRLNAIGAWS